MTHFSMFFWPSESRRGRGFQKKVCHMTHFI
jgi:hypothetical protein